MAGEGMPGEGEVGCHHQVAVAVVEVVHLPQEGVEEGVGVADLQTEVVEGVVEEYLSQEEEVGVGVEVVEGHQMKGLGDHGWWLQKWWHLCLEWSAYNHHWGFQQDKISSTYMPEANHST